MLIIDDLDCGFVVVNEPIRVENDVFDPLAAAEAEYAHRGGDGVVQLVAVVLGTLEDVIVKINLSYGVFAVLQLSAPGFRIAEGVIGHIDPLLIAALVEGGDRQADVPAAAHIVVGVDTVGAPRHFDPGVGDHAVGGKHCVATDGHEV